MTVVDQGRAPLIFRVNWGPKGWENFSRVPAPRPLSQGLDPTLKDSRLYCLSCPSTSLALQYGGLVQYEWLYLQRAYYSLTSLLFPLCLTFKCILSNCRSHSLCLIAVLGIENERGAEPLRLCPRCKTEQMVLKKTKDGRWDRWKKDDVHTWVLTGRLKGIRDQAWLLPNQQ